MTEKYLKRGSSFGRVAILSLALLAGIFCGTRGVVMAEDDPILARILEKRDPAPELSGASAWINSEKPVTLADLKGKIVLLDFWTFG